MKGIMVLGSIFVLLLMLVSAMGIHSIPLVKGDDGTDGTDGTDGSGGGQQQYQPDLVVWQLGVQDLFGGWYRLNVEIKNIDYGDAGPFYDHILWDGSPLVNDVYHLKLNHLTVSSYSVDFQAQKGWHTITVITDYYNDVAESNENNNRDNITYFYWWIG